MANANAPYGLKPVSHLDGSPWNGVVRMYYIPESDTNAYYIGDAVRAVADGDLVNGVPAVTLYGTRNAASTTGAMRGVVTGVGSSVNTPGGSSPQAFDPDNLNVLFIPATKTKDYYVWVVDDPSVVFEAQADTFANTAFNKNAPLFVANAPTAPVNQSASYVQGSAAAVTQALPLKIVGAPATPDNDTSTPGTNARVWVKINQHELANNTVGV
jgi:hypothetical protein